MGPGQSIKVSEHQSIKVSKYQSIRVSEYQSESVLVYQIAEGNFKQIRSEEKLVKVYRFKIVGAL